MLMTWIILGTRPWSLCRDCGTHLSHGIACSVKLHVRKMKRFFDKRDRERASHVVFQVKRCFRYLLVTFYMTFAYVCSFRYDSYYQQIKMLENILRHDSCYNVLHLSCSLINCFMNIMLYALCFQCIFR